MFNNLSYRIAKLNELYPQSFLTRWYIQNPNLPEIKRYLEDIYIDMTYNHLDINFVKYLYNNLDDGFYAYVLDNLDRIDSEEIKQKFKKASAIDKKVLLLSNPQFFIIRGNISANNIYNIFVHLIRLINILHPKVGGDINTTFDLINIFNDPGSTNLEEIYKKRMSRAPYRRARECDKNSLWYLNKISQYISEDIENRKDLIKHITNQEDFLEYINYDDEELFIDLYHNGFFEEDANINLRFLRHELNKKFINSEKYWEDKKSKSTKVPSKYFNDFNLDNSSNKEKQIFADFEKLGLHAIPAEQKSSMSMLDENGEKFGFRIDFLLPCNVREYDGENYSLRQDIIFIGEYFGYFGADYDAKKVKKMQWQNSFEKSLDQRCLHIDLNTDLCSVLKEKNIDSKCYPDFNGHLFDVKDNDQRKSFYVKSQLQNFIYTYLVNELLWQIGYNYNLNTIDNFNKVKEKNKNYIDGYNDLIAKSSKLKPSELVLGCAKVLNDYKNVFAREKKLGEKSLRLSKTFNNRKNPSIL